MTLKQTSLLLLGALCSAAPAFAFEIEDFKSGAGREQIKQALQGWGFDQVLDVASDTIIAQDLPEKKTNRQFRFVFCNEKLAALDQALQPSVKNFIISASNNIKSYGQPFKVDSSVNVISNGEKTTLAMFWRVRNDVVGLRYFQYPNGEDMLVTFETPNNCWQVPRP